MSWILLATIAPILWAVVNHIDKYLLSDRFEGENVGALMIFSCLIPLASIPVFFLLSKSGIGFHDALIMVITGAVGGLAILLYLYALDEDEASIVIPFFQLIPVFGFFIGYAILGESLTTIQILASLLILAGSAILSLELDEDNKIKFRKKTTLLMIVSCFMLAANEVLFKFVAENSDFWRTSVWEYVGLGIFGAILFIFIKKFRFEFYRLFKTNGGKILSLNVGSEAITVVGNLAFRGALLLAPVVMVQTISGTQPLFVFIIGILLTTLFPKLGKESLKFTHLAQKIVAILLIVIGTIALI